MEKLATLFIGVVSGAMAAFYGPYLSELIKARREKRALRLAIYRELLYMYRLVSDLFEYYPNLLGDDAKHDEVAKDAIVFFLKWYRTFLYERDLYTFVRKDFNYLRLFYQLEDAFVIEKTYIDFYRAFHPDISPGTPEEQVEWLSMYRLRFSENVRSGALSKPLLKQTSMSIHYGREAIEKLISQS